MQIQVVKVGEDITKTSAKGTAYKQVQIDFLEGGRASKRQIMSFTKDVYTPLRAASEGDIFEVQAEQNGQYTNWVRVEKVGTAAPAAVKTAAAVKSTYETSEERARKQVYIVRQSSVANAVAYFQAIGKTDADLEDVIATARTFEAYVFEPVSEEEFTPEEVH